MDNEKNIIDRTNRFYLDMSKNVLTEREHEIMYQMLIDKKPIVELASHYNLSRERIRQIYKDAYDKIKSFTDLFKDIDYYKRLRNKLREDYRTEYRKLRKPDNEGKEQVLNKKLIDSAFPFSKRLWNMLMYLDINTIGDLTSIPLPDYEKFRGFKTVSKKELLSFIEFENIEDLFDDYTKWSKNF